MMPLWQSLLIAYTRRSWYAIRISIAALAATSGQVD